MCVSEDGVWKFLLSKKWIPQIKYVHIVRVTTSIKHPKQSQVDASVCYRATRLIPGWDAEVIFMFCYDHIYEIVCRVPCHYLKRPQMKVCLLSSSEMWVLGSRTCDQNVGCWWGLLAALLMCMNKKWGGGASLWANMFKKYKNSLLYLLIYK